MLRRRTGLSFYRHVVTFPVLTVKLFFKFSLSVVICAKMRAENAEGELQGDQKDQRKAKPHTCSLLQTAVYLINQITQVENEQLGFENTNVDRCNFILILFATYLGRGDMVDRNGFAH